jgi:hypothetical protein
VLQELITPEHFFELLAYDRLNPPDAIKWEFYFSQLAMLVHNSNVAKKEHLKSQSEFLFKKPKPKNTLSEDLWFASLVALTKSAGGHVDGNHSEALHDVHG